MELAIRTLQSDYSQLRALKMHKLYAHMIEQFLKNLRLEYETRKQLLVKKNIRFVQLVKIDEYFCDALLATAGEDLAMRYANQALKREVEQLLIKELKNKSLFSKKDL
ncbi:aconitate hydratase [Bacillus ndiopicus]|uniref:aconitate hydratase n=1 Tax=Bacillus ndiopicus TaxID=1347368 RepID=UPI000AA51E3C|nr:aconitate hydratase [Bacillus ndiopicus]